MDRDHVAELDLAPVSNDELTWVASQFETLQRQYGGQWIAVDSESVIAHGTNLADVAHEVTSNGFHDAYYEWLPPRTETPPVLIL